ncbi:hypothetical protein D3C80_1727990 [compost metagenome]
MSLIEVAFFATVTALSPGIQKLYVGSLDGENKSRMQTSTINSVGSVPAGRVNVLVPLAVSVSVNFAEAETTGSCPERTPTSICVLLRVVILASYEMTLL